MNFSFKKSFFIVFLLFVNLSYVKSQTVLDLTTMGGSSQDIIKCLVTDKKENIYVLGQAAYQLHYNGIAINYYQSSSSYTYLLKLDKNKNLIWFKAFNYCNSSVGEEQRIAIDTNSNIYITDSYMYGFSVPPYSFPYGQKSVTFKLDSLGTIQWAINSGGLFFSSEVTNHLEFKNFHSYNDSLNGQKITNVIGVVARLDLNGNYISHFQIDNPSYQFEAIKGKITNTGIYYGYRNPTVNITIIDKFELFKADSLGNVLTSKIAHYGFQVDNINSIVYDENDSSFYYTANLCKRTPLNSPSGTNLINLMLVKTDLNFNPISTLEMGNTLNLAGGSQAIKLKIINKELFLTGRIHNYSTGPNLWNCYGQSNYMYPVNDKLVFAKFNSNLSLLWNKEIPVIYYAGQLYPPVKHNGKLIYFGETQAFTMNGNTFQTQGTDDAFMMDVQDDSTKSISIKGEIFNDSDQNGIFSVNEQPVANSRIINKQLTSYYQFSSSTGEYNSPGINGTQIIKSLDLPLYWSRSTPDSVQVINTSNDTSISNINFGMYPIPGVVDLQVDITPITAARPGFDVTYRVDVCNIGTTATNAIIKFKQDPNLHFLNSSIPIDSVSSDTIYYHISSFGADSCTYFLINDSLAANPILIGSHLNQEIIACTNLPDTVPSDNISILHHLVSGSYDPNDISVFPDCDISQSFIQKRQELTYLIRFQNTGTDTAFAVTVIDTLPSNLNISDFQYISSSHKVQYSIKNNILKIQFDKINLLSQSGNEFKSKGYFKFKIKPIASLSPGSQIKSTAAIFFDYNPPIITNTVNTNVKALNDMVTVLSHPASCNNNGKMTFTPINCNNYKIFLKVDSGNFNQNTSLLEDSLSLGVHTFTFVIGNDTVIKSVNILYSPDSYTKQLSICHGDSIFLQNSFQSYSGLYTDTLITLNGCDSIIKTNLIILAHDSTYQSMSICSNDSINIHGNYVSQSGIYSSVFQNKFGCDSISTVELQTVLVDTSLIVSENVLISNFTNSGVNYQWLNCSNGYSQISGETNDIFFPTENGFYALQITYNGCIDTSNCHTIISLGVNDIAQGLSPVVSLNQSTNELIVTLQNSCEVFSIEIFNIEGKLIENREFQNTNKCNVFLNGSPGLYFMKIYCLQEYIGVYKFLKN